MMKVWRVFSWRLALAVLLVLAGAVGAAMAVGAQSPPRYAATDDDLVFLHHSCGQNWLSNSLHEALLAKDYVDERNDIYYGTSMASDDGRPASLGDTPGDNTDMRHWVLWFNDYLDGVRTHQSENGFNKIIMFKSCYPASNIGSEGTEPGDPFSGSQTTANYKAVYRHPDGTGNTYSRDGYTYKPLEDIFAENPDILFIPVTAPPLHYAPSDATSDENAHRARMFNNWLKNNWLDSYNAAHPGLNNVAVFDWFDVLAYPDDHVEHPNRLTAEYGGDSGNSHPNSTANAESTQIFATNPDNFLDSAWDAFVGSQPESVLEAQKTVSAKTAKYGQVLSYTLVIRATPAPISATVHMTDTLPTGLTYAPGTLSATSGTPDDSGAPRLRWSGPLTPTPVVTVTYAANVTYGKDNTGDFPHVLVNSVSIAAPGYATLTCTAAVTVVRTTPASEVDLTPSYKVVSPPYALQGERVTYTVAISNASGPLTHTVFMTDTVPEGLSYVAGSMRATAGVVDDSAAPTLHWCGALSPTVPVFVTYAADVNEAVTGTPMLPRTITNEAVIAVPGYQSVVRTATLQANGWRIFLPVVMRNYTPNRKLETEN